jgi:hypothetical protein
VRPQDEQQRQKTRKRQRGKPSSSFLLFFFFFFVRCFTSAHAKTTQIKTGKKKHIQWKVIDREEEKSRWFF